MARILFSLALVVAILLAWSKPAEAAESYDSCTGFINSLPATITTQGTWCLRKNLSTAITSGQAITIASNNVTLDCNGFKIGGLAGGTGTKSTGIGAASRLNATVRNCNIRGFYHGIHFVGPNGGGHLVEDNTFDGNTRYGMVVTNSPGSTIRDNQVLDTGGSSIAGHAHGIYAVNGVDIINNTINGVVPTSGANAYGIRTAANGAGSVVGNRIRGLAPSGGGAPLGIFNGNSGRTVIFENVVQGPGSAVAGGIGIRCESNAASARHNMVLGFNTGIQTCLSSANSVNNN